MDEELPENRRPHAQHVSFSLIEAGCRPAGCCTNTACEKISNDQNIPNQVEQCAQHLPMGCYFYARATANITGSMCRSEHPHQSIWSYPTGAAFDMMDLGGWSIPSYTLWRFHNVAAAGCDKITVGTQSNVSNIDRRAIRPCSWETADDSEMLIESNGAPMSAFSSATIQIGNFTNDVKLTTTSTNDIVTLRLRSVGRSHCKFTLANYFEFPLLEVPLQLLVTSEKAITEYVSAAVDKTIRESVKEDLNVAIPLHNFSQSSINNSLGRVIDLGVPKVSRPDRLSRLIDSYGRLQVAKLYLKYLTSHPQLELGSAKRRQTSQRGSSTPQSWPPVNWAWPGAAAAWPIKSIYQARSLLVQETTTTSAVPGSAHSNTNGGDSVVPSLMSILFTVFLILKLVMSPHS